jgi:two-component system KDP operon response regulator KdpE
VSEGRVLVVDDEPQMRRALQRALKAHAYQVELAANGATALDLLAKQDVDMVLLDLMMPGIDGFEVLRRTRTWSRVPIIVLTARGDEADTVAALDLGADDYLTKPFGIEVLLARLRAVRRRMAEPQRSVFVAGDVTIDLERQIVIRGDDPVHLAPIELDIIAVLVEHRGVTVEYHQLVAAVWGPEGTAPDELPRLLQALRVHINALRRKLEPDPYMRRLILTEPGIGYRLWSSP